MNWKWLFFFEDWVKIELRVGLIESVDDVEGKDKLYRFMWILGQRGRELFLLGLNLIILKRFVEQESCFVFNLAPRTLAGFESQGMILAMRNNLNEYKITLVDDSVSQVTRLE